MNQNARVHSIEALAALRRALLKFQEACADSLTSLQLESRRAAEWVEVEQANYWPAQGREASDDLKSAEVQLERCELAMRPEDRRSCLAEKKAVEQARRRLRLCEDKLRVVRQWALVMNQETRELHGDLSRLQHYLDNDLPQAVAQLENMQVALTRYAQSAQPGREPPTPSQPANESEPQ